MLPILALISLFLFSEGFERSNKPHIAHLTKARATEIDRTTLFVPENDLKAKIEDGAKKLATLQRDSPCWLEVQEKLITTQCNNLHSQEKERLTIALTNCHLERTGLPSIHCTAEMHVDECLKRLGDHKSNDNKHYETYTTFKLHFDEMCFFLKRQAFQEDTQRAVNSLYVATLETSTNLQNFAQNAEDARVQLTHLVQEQQQELNTHFDEFHYSHMEKFEQLTKTAELLDSKQDMMVYTLQQKSEALHSVLEKSLTIQQDVQSNQSSLLEQFNRANQTLARLENHQESALALVHNTTENLQQLAQTQRNAFSETNKSLLSLARQQHVIDSSLQQSLQSSTQLNVEQAKLFDLLSQQNTQIETRHQDFLSILSATKEGLNELATKQKASFENSAHQVSQIANEATLFAQHIHLQLDESKKVQDLALKSVSGGFAAISSSQDEIHQRQQQLLSSVAGTHDKLEELQQRNKDSFEAASTHLASIREQSQQAEERVQKVMAGLENRLEAGFERLLSLDHSILGELFTIKALVFYVSCAVAIFLCTANKHTQRIRLYLFLALALSYYMETHALYLSDWLLFADPLTVIALMRKLFVGTVLTSLAIAVWRFRDYHELSYEIAVQNQDMLCAIMRHLRQKAVTHHVDCSDLDSVLLSGKYKLPIDPKQFPHKVSLVVDVPALECMHERNELKNNYSASMLDVAAEAQEQLAEEELLQEIVEEESVENQSSMNSPSEQAVEPDEKEEKEVVTPLSPRCPAIAKTSGVQCRNSARKCGAHRVRF